MKDRIQEIEELIEFSNQRFTKRESEISQWMNLIKNATQSFSHNNERDMEVVDLAEEVTIPVIEDQVIVEISDEIPIIQESQSVNRFCTQCGKALTLDARFCKFCGQKIKLKESPKLLCSCGKEIKPGAKFCRFCGTKFDE